MADLIQKELQNGVLKLQLNFSENNAFGPAAFEALRRALDEGAANAAVRALSLGSAAAGFYSNGLDPSAVHGADAAQIETLTADFFDVLRKLYLFPAPAVAAINGHAIGYGAMLAIMCDFRLLVDKGARMSFPELNIGVTLPSFVCRRLFDLVGERASRDFLFSGLAPKPPEALQLGLVDELAAAEEVDARAASLAQKLARLPPQATRAQKMILRRTAMAELDEMLQRDREETRQLLKSPEAAEGFAALVEKRRPRFN